MSRRRVLFVANAVTLAHVARPAALMAALDAQRHEAYFACDARQRRFVATDDARFRALPTLAPDVFTARLARGKPVFTADELQRDVDADLALLRDVQPDLVVGDFRLSLSASTRLAGVRYATISNAYWSPWAEDRRLPLPVLPWTRHVPLALAQRGFDAVQRLVLAPHVAPLNRVRAARGLAPLPADLRRVYTDADDTLYADAQSLFPTPGAPAGHRHVGPLIWAPPVALPPWWAELRDDAPIVYVTMGSSGRVDVLAEVFDALRPLGVQVIASTAGMLLPGRRTPDVHVADYLPGTAAAARSALVVCNGGSPTAQQALAAAVPVLGLCSNMDQMLNMRGLQRAGLGIGLRIDRLGADAIGAAARTLIAQHAAASATARAARFAAAGEPDAAAAFRAFLGEVLP